MGPAHSMVVNKTHKKVCILTFNEADLLYYCKFVCISYYRFLTLQYLHSKNFVSRVAYCNMYILEPGESKQVEASLSNPIGLKIAIVFDAAPDGQLLMYKRWQCKNESVLTITSINGEDIATYGGILIITTLTNSN